MSAFALNAGDMAVLQVFFEENPEYFWSVNGEFPKPDEALQEWNDEMPHGWAFKQRWMIGMVNEGGNLVGTMSLVSDFLATGVWHIGLFVVATALHGSGVAKVIYEQLELWMQYGGARWLRLGVVVGNEKAERFWTKAGFREVRQRTGLVMGKRTNDVRVMVKPLVSESFKHYLDLVARDKEDAL